MNKPILSICIPTYNRADVVKECVKKLLVCKRDDIEIVVIDNCSDDNTALYMKELQDSRLKFERNEKNYGASYNIHKTFLKASGKYMLLISDEDDVLHEQIDYLVECFKKNDDIAVMVVGGKRGENDLKVFPDKEYDTGFDALMEIGFCVRYMTGVILNGEMYKKYIGEVSYEESAFKFNTYSFIYAMAILSMHGRNITSSRMVYEQTRYAKTHRTNNSMDQVDVFYYEPLGRKGQIFCWNRAVSELGLSKVQKIFVSLKIMFDSTTVALRVYNHGEIVKYKRMASDKDFDDFVKHIGRSDIDETVNMLLQAGIEAMNTNDFCAITCFEELEEIDVGLYKYYVNQKIKLDKLVEELKQ